LKTILSRREFRAGSLYTVCLWLTAEATVSLEEIKRAIERPVFQLFAGRKAVPLMLPAQPEIVEADSLEAAFAARDSREREQQPAIAKLRTHFGLAPRTNGPIFEDVDVVPLERRERLEERRDVPESRAKWRFGLRTEALLR